MTLPSSVQRYNNSCVIPKSYEQKKVATPLGIATPISYLQNPLFTQKHNCLRYIRIGFTGES